MLAGQAVPNGVAAVGGEFGARILGHQPILSSQQLAAHANASLMAGFQMMNGAGLPLSMGNALMQPLCKPSVYPEYSGCEEASSD